MRLLMRTTVAFLLLLAAAPAHAQLAAPADSDRCYSVSATRVDVRLKDGTLTRGTLVCLGPEQAVLAGAGQVTTFRLSDVTRIEKPADPTWDGALKGAAIGGLLMLFCGDCQAWWVLRTVGLYAAAGAIVDSFDTHSEVLYQNRSKGVFAAYRWKF